MPRAQSMKKKKVSMNKKEAIELANIILLSNHLRNLLVELDGSRDEAAFDDKKRQGIEKTIQAAESKLKKVASILKGYGLYYNLI